MFYEEKNYEMSMKYAFCMVVLRSRNGSGILKGKLSFLSVFVCFIYRNDHKGDVYLCVMS